ncbi:hypothetical protein ACFQE8_13070 [Salinirubellus sp. GCM10025818]|uniref:hypothetical protein n=1 Tax=Salinirubellus TaxID=2162630 RepID=UPI0030D0A2E0
MEEVRFTVHGETVGELPSAVRGFPQNKRVDYGGDGFAVIVTEQYYFRTNSNLQTTTIFELVDHTTCEVAVVSGGGGAGLLQHDWGTESGESNELLGKLEEFCREHGLSIEHE